MAPLPDPLPLDDVIAQQRFLRSVARQLVRDAATADDVVQESYLRALEEPHARPRSVRAWLGRVVANLAHDRRRGELRRERREQEVASAAGCSTPADRSPAAIAARVEMQRRLAERVLALAPAYRDVVLLHHFEGLSVAETAARLSVPLETARTRLRRALEQLRTQLEGELGGRGELLAALLPLATFVVPALPIATTATATATATTAATVAAAGGALLGVPLAMSTTSKLALAALAAFVAGGVWLFAGGTLGPDAPRLATPQRAPAEAAAPADVDPLATAAPIVAERAAAPAATPPPAALEPQPGRAALRLTTLQADGRPAPRLRLRLHSREAERDLEPLRRVSSDDAGLLWLDDLEPGEVVVAAAGFARRPDSGDGALLADGAYGVIDLTLEAGVVREATLRLPDGHPVRGRVVDGASRPIAGAAIWVSDRQETWSGGDFVTQSDERGDFELPAVGTYHYAAARAAGLGWSEVVSVDTSDPTRVAPVELRLDRPGATLRGRVLDAAGEPIGGARLVAIDDSRGSRLTNDQRILGDPPPTVTRTAPDGTFTIESLPFCTLDLLVDHPRFAPHHLEFEIAAADVTRDVTLQQGGSLAVTVVDGRGVALPAIDVQLQLMMGPFPLERLNLDARSAEDGRLRFERLPVTPSLLTAAAPGRAPSKRFLQLDGGAQQTELVMGAALTLRGRVVDDAGRGCAGIGVQLTPSDLSLAKWSPPLTTDEEGYFTLTDCADLPYEASLHHPTGMSMFAARRGIVVRPGDELHVLVLGEAQRAASSLRGRVVAANGQPVALPSAQFGEEGGNFALSVTLDADGRFELGPLPAGRFWLVVGAEGLANRSVGAIELAAGEVRDLGDLALAEPAGLRILARRSDGGRVKPADLRLHRHGGYSGAEFTVDGEALRCSGLAHGDYTLEVVGAGLAWQQVAVQLDAGHTREVTLDVEAGVAVKLTLRRADGAPLGESIQLTASDAAGERVSKALRPSPADREIADDYCLAPGDWTLEVVAPDGARCEVAVKLVRGAAREVVLELAAPRH
ncbi:MAG: sigma-70 family RNA polymerase sigma factor [Planctomycetes bacterium]|nr:sigma-70 family RNA polymerase sigma factor [Planctomycetota bacterium]